LPHFQKLYDKLKTRSDIVVLTLNIDDNIGLIDPFMQQNKYTFPVLQAKSLYDQLVPFVGIPRNWIVDASGVLRLEQMGFLRNDKWEELMLEALEKATTSRGPA
jgi:hypothetical protein